MGWFTRKPRRVGFGDGFKNTHTADDHRKRSAAAAAAPKRATQARAPNARASSPWTLTKPLDTATGRKMPVILYLLAGLLVLSGVVMGTFVGESAHITSSYQLTTAEVIARNAYDEEDGTRSYAPIFRWTDADGREWIATSDMRSSAYDYPNGARIEIWYDPASNGDVRINDWFSLWGVSTIVGGFTVILALAIAVIYRRRNRSPG